MLLLQLRAKLPFSAFPDMLICRTKPRISLPLGRHTGLGTITFTKEVIAKFFRRIFSLTKLLSCLFKTTGEFFLQFSAARTLRTAGYFASLLRRG
jgi:hypothetical protein